MRKETEAASEKKGGAGCVFWWIRTRFMRARVV
jgi:hypothetical protein